VTVRLLNPAPAVYDLGQLRTLAQARFGSALLDLNEVRDGTTQIAVYLPSTPNGAKATAWTNDLATYTLSHPSEADFMANQRTIQDALQTAVTYFGGNYTNWSSLSNAQKDAAARNGQRALAQITRWLLGQFDSAG
jgi:hypothetical protein